MIAVLAATGCFDPQFADGQLTCPGNVCPDGFVCAVDGFCRRDSSAADASFGAGDADPIDSIPGLLLWYPLDDAQFDGLAVDATSGGRPGRCDSSQTCPAPAAGRIGGGARFDGENDHLRTGFDSELNTTSGFTIAAWSFANSFTTFNAVFSKPFGSDTTNTWQIELPSSLIWRFQVGGAGDGTSAEGPAEVETWTHTAGTWDGQTIILYIDGVEIARADALSVGFDDHDLFVGGDENGGVETGFWQGLIDDVRLYDRALTAAEVAQLASPPE